MAAWVSSWAPGLLSLSSSERVTLRIIPHRSALNSGNRRLWRQFHDLLRQGRFDWRTRTYYTPDSVEWIVTLDPMAFYVTLPRDFASVFTTKLKTHEQWARCTVQEVNEPPALNGEPFYLRLARHDMFSLSIDYSRQTGPIRELLAAALEMEPGERAAFAMRLTPVSWRRWKGVADYGWDVWRRGGMPSRPGFDPERTGRMTGAALVWAAVSVVALLEDTIRAVGRVFFNDRDEPKTKMPVLADPDREALGQLSTATMNKRNLPVYRAEMAVVVDSPNEARRRMLAHSMASALRDLDGDNRLVFGRGRSLLSSDEVGRLVQLPTADVQDEFAGRLEANRAVEIVVPAAFSGSEGLYMGESEVKGERTPVYWPVEDLDWAATPRVFMGSPRMGKDMAIVNMLVEASARGIGAVVLDVIDERNGHRGMSDALRDHLPPDRVVDLDLSNFDYPVYVGPALIPAARNERVAAGNIADVVASFFMEGEQGDMHQTEGVLTEAAKLVRGDVLGIKRILTDQRFRAQALYDGRARGFDLTSLEDYHRCSEGRQGQIAAPVLARIGHILRNEALRPIFCQRPNPDLRLADWMKDGKVVLYRIPNRPDAFGERGAQLLCHWLVLTVFLIKQSTGGPLTYLVLNEPHQYLSPGFVRFCERILAEGPKHRLAPVFAFHYFRQFREHAGLVDALLAANTNWHLFRNSGAREYERLKALLEPVFTPETALQQTRAYHYIAVWVNEERRHDTPFMVKAPPPVWERVETRKHEWLTLRHARQYGRPFREVEEEIRAAASA